MQRSQLGGQSGIGERALGRDDVRIVGAMFPDPNYAPAVGVRDMRFGLQSYALSFPAWQIFLNLVHYRRPEPDLAVGAISVASKVAKGTARITASIANPGTASAAASTTSILVDGKLLGQVATAAVPAGSSVQVTVLWPTKGVRGLHTISVVSDALNVIDELDEANNGGSLRVSVWDNVVKPG